MPEMLILLPTIASLLLVLYIITAIYSWRSLHSDHESLLNNQQHTIHPLKRTAACLLLGFSLLSLGIDIYLLVISDLIFSTSIVLDLENIFIWTLILLVSSIPSHFRIYDEYRHSLFTIDAIWKFSALNQFVSGIYWTFSIWQNPQFYKHPTSLSLFISFVVQSFIIFTTCIWILNKKRPIETSENGHETAPSFKKSWKKILKLIPFIWPKGWYLQLLAIACYILLFLGRVVNVLVPIAYKRLVDDLSSASYIPLFALSFYICVRFLQGGVGLLSSLQYFLWIPIGQYTTREVSVKMLDHLHSLSFKFHVQRKTGEVLRVIDRGTASIGSLLSYLAFNILPVFVDIGVAIIYFIYAFDWTIALVVFLTMILYIFLTVWITEWRTGFRREMNELDNSSRSRAVDSLLNFETVKYYGNEDWEVSEYEKSIIEYQKSDWKSSASLNLLNTAQNLVITIGVFVGIIICANQVVAHTLTIGDFVAFITYLLQLYQPLNWFGTYYRVIQQNFIDMEKMLELFESGESIKDCPDACELKVTKGDVSFENVSFCYDPEKPALKNITFSIPSGKKVALVGPSGGGKTTLMRLLFRFYDLQSGKISIDGQDITKVTQKSLRNHIGVVPQDTVLFNDTVGFNIEYGRIGASQEEIESVAKAAQIHEKILAFPMGYQTKVGERGLKLSGGEKQRVAIARTLLKNPSIILFDEATSALDNTTEVKIQDALKKLCADRTTLVIAHRLSTIVDADEILVLKDGRIVERGTHEELLRKDKTNGVYYQMWTRELKNE